MQTDLYSYLCTKKMRRNMIIIGLMIMLAGMSLFAQQIQISADYLSRTIFSDRQKNNYGKGEMMGYSLKYNQPLPADINEYGQPTAWAISLIGSYYDFENYGEAQYANPDEVLNASINLSHIRPLSERWSIIALIGCGVYSNPKEIGWKSVLANGGCIFIYKINESFSIGAGLGLTNAYDVPMIAPMGYVKWNLKSWIDIDINVSNSIKATASTWIGNRFKLSWHILEMDGISSVINIGDKSKLYSSMLLSSFISPSFYLSKKSSIYLDVGVNIARTIRTTDRKIKYMFAEIKEEDKRSFKPACKVGIGVRYGF